MPLLVALLFAILLPSGCDCFGTPPPEGLPAGAELDEDTVQLADGVRAFAPEDPPQLVSAAVKEALLQTGFGVRSDGFALVYDDNDNLGVVFEQWDADTIAVNLQQGLAIPLDEYAGTWADLVDGDAAEVRRALLHDLAAAAASDDPLARRYAQLIVALGRSSPAPGGGYDLLDADVDGAAPIDALQMGLMTYLISAELWQSVRNADGSQQTQGLDGSAPCTMTDTEGLVMDGAAVGSGLVWGGVLDHLSDKGVAAADKFGLATTVANAGLVYLKLAWTMAVFKMDMSVTPQPLVRTENTVPGQPGTAKATFRLDGTGNAQIVNCVRLALNTMNLDFSLPQDGPLAGKRVVWEIQAKGADDVIESTSGDVLHHETNSSGESTFTFRGKAQKKKLEGKLVDVTRRPLVRASVNLKNKDFIQDLIDAGAGVGGLGALLAVPAEILNRRPLLFTGAKVVVVKDKKELIGDHFHISGDFYEPFGGVLAKDQRDHIDADVEIKIVDGELKGELLDWSDTQATELDDYEPTGPGGEGCIQTTTIQGRDDAFTSRHQERVDGAYSPGAPDFGVPEMAYVTVSVPGYSTRRGYTITNDHPSCPDSVNEPGVEETVFTIPWDSSQLPTVGSTYELPPTESDGTGWRFTVTYVE